EGYDLVNPVSTEAVEWIRIFDHWQDKAVLTPIPPGLWGPHEAALSRKFVTMPATLAGLELTAESFAIREPVEIPEALKGKALSPPYDINSEEGLQELRTYLGDETYQWLCACAVHPQLQWDLTIHLGNLFSVKQNLV